MLKFSELKEKYLDEGENEDSVRFAERLYVVWKITGTARYYDLLGENRKQDIDVLFELIWNYLLVNDRFKDIDKIIEIVFEYDTFVDKILSLYYKGELNNACDSIARLVDTLFIE